MAESVSSWKIGHGSRAYLGGGGSGGENMFFKSPDVVKIECAAFG